MGLKDRRRLTKAGKYSKVITLPAKLKMGEEVTLAADRLILVDPRGEIHESDLLEFLEKYVEPKFWPWVEDKRMVQGA